MATGELAGKLADGSPRLTVDRMLDLCDRVLGESGRRRHVFSWLRAPGAGPESWLAVDGYYPAHRLVVVWHQRSAEHEPVYLELVPAHGLRLLELSPAIAGDDEAAELALRRMVGALDPPPTRPTLQIAGRGREHAPRDGTAAYGALLGVALAAVLFIEVYFAVARAALDGGQIVLAFGLAIDTCSRMLGTVAASRVRATGWAWWCALGGSPLVAIFARFQRSGPVTAEPAPLAGILALVALGAVLLALLTGR